LISIGKPYQIDFWCKFYSNCYPTIAAKRKEII